MTLLHISLAAADPRATAATLAQIMGGTAMPFPPCDGAWIAFSKADDGTALEVYPLTTRITPGPDTIAFTRTPTPEGNSSCHVALTSALTATEIIQIGKTAGWRARRCDRGPFRCVELWVENRFLIEVLDHAMLADYRDTMTAANWQTMFDLPGDI
jgi:hypothetical protein